MCENIPGKSAYLRKGLGISFHQAVCFYFNLSVWFKCSMLFIYYLSKIMLFYTHTFIVVLSQIIACDVSF